MKFKRFLCLVLCVCMSLTLFIGLADTASADDVIVHTVQNGEYLFKICKSYGLDYYQCKNAIMALNGFTLETQLNRLSVGQKIKLPANNALAASAKASTTTTTTVSATVGGTTTTTTTTSTSAGVAPTGYAVAFYLVPHTVKGGETLNDICNLYGTNYYTYSSMILAMNGIKNAASVWAGKTIYVPAASAPAGGTFYSVIAHSVKSGETLTSICSQYGMNYGGLKTVVDGLNAGTNINSIKVGQIVYVPVTGSVGTTVTSGTSSAATSSASTAPVNTGYSIIFSSVIDGAPYATVNGAAVSRANAGTTVHVVGNPAQGFAVKSVNVIRTDTNAKVDISGTTLNFTMPSSDVKITVTYGEAHSILKEASVNGKFACSVGGEISGYANYGDIVTITAFPSEDYAVKVVSEKYQVYYKQVVLGVATGSPIYIERNNDSTFSFKMPNYDVKVYVEFEQAKYFAVNTIMSSGGAVTFSVGGTKVSRAAKGATVDVQAEAATGWKIVGAVLEDNGGNDISKSCGLNKTGDGTWSFIMPGKDIILRFNVQRTVTYKISQVKATGGSLRFQVRDQYTGALTYADVAKPQDTVRVVPDVVNGYEYKGVNVRYSNGLVDVPTGGNLATYVEFTMPDADVVVTPQWVAGAVRRNIIRVAPSHGMFELYVIDTADDTKFYPGASSIVGNKVKLNVVPDPGYILGEIKINGVAWPMTDLGGGWYEFLMPDHDIRVEVTFVPSNKFYKFVKGPAECAAEGVTIGTISAKVEGIELPPSGNEVKGGAKIIITPPSMTGYELDRVKVTTDPGAVDDSARVVSQGDGTYYYIVPDSTTVTTITISAEYRVTVLYDLLYSIPDYSGFGDYKITVKGTDFTNNIQVANGQTVTLEITAGTMKNMIINDVYVTEQVSGGKYTFTMTPETIKTQVIFE